MKSVLNISDQERTYTSEVCLVDFQLLCSKQHFERNHARVSRSTPRHCIDINSSDVHTGVSVERGGKIVINDGKEGTSGETMEDEEICPSRTKKYTIDHFGVTQFNGRTVGTYIHTRSTWIRSSRARRPPYSRADLHTLHNRPALALFNLEKAASSPPSLQL